MAVAKLECNILKIPSHNVIFISDTHFGTNSSSEEWQENINDYFENWFYPFVKDVLSKKPDTVLLCLGDVYHDRKSIDIDVNNLCIDVFEELAKMIPCYIIYGNHDLSKKTNKGNSSLRSLENINNLTVIKEPTMLQFVDGRKNVSKMIAIPYLGDCNEENKQLMTYAGKADYALMHTDISNMKFDNGMTIVGAVDAEKFSGKVISGHIHKRQESKKVLYVGSPYQLSRGDIDNQKGIYMLDLDTNEFSFTPNNYSPIFQKVDITLFLNMTQAERDDKLRNTYTDIIIDDSEIDKYKQSDLYEMLNKSTAKRTQVRVIKTKKNADNESENEEELVELSIEQLIMKTIDNIQDISDEDRDILKSKASEYYKNALTQLEDAQ